MNSTDVIDRVAVRLYYNYIIYM